ncbi:MAG: hypothetical protein U0269_17135 [Polyangiales bacterium]
MKGRHAGACYLLGILLSNCSPLEPPEDAARDGGASAPSDVSAIVNRVDSGRVDSGRVDSATIADVVVTAPDTGVGSLPDVVAVPADASSVDPRNPTSRVELVFVASNSGPNDDYLLASLRAMFAVGPTRTFNRAMVPSVTCEGQQVENCTVSDCGRILPSPSTSAGELAVHDGLLQFSMSASLSGWYPEVGANNPPWVLSGSTLISAAGSSEVPPWAVSLETPGLARFASPPPAMIHRTEPLELSMGPQGKVAGRRAVVVQASGNVTMYCSFDAGAAIRISPAALSHLPAGPAVITPSAINEEVVHAGGERILVSSLVTVMSGITTTIY